MIKNIKLILSAVVVVLWAASLWYVDHRRYNERNAYWERKISSAEVKIETTYVEIPAQAKAVQRGESTNETAWRAKLDSIKAEAGRSTTKLKAELERIAKSYVSVYHYNLEVEPQDTAQRFSIPIELRIESNPLQRSHQFLLEPKPFSIPSRIIVQEKQILVEVDRPWWEIPAVAVVGVAIGYFLAQL